ncbi:hypothetical protein [Paenibacillus roseipurpureus]|uniref:Uncharacterized protein n=1 Tax=Paenibacillus roseopurpureus TaxID=2918901 RepID=A0AA96LVD7_9BACL|nr:hypothetical protein [Paenibacillus sp. MBLB1832]WNR46783.1 hypothetical protein MJB10_12035 [Paenibacillus sp. MBLB1832]
MDKLDGCGIGDVVSSVGRGGDGDTFAVGEEVAVGVAVESVSVRSSQPTRQYIVDSIKIKPPKYLRNGASSLLFTYMILTLYLASKFQFLQK